MSLFDKVRPGLLFFSLVARLREVFHPSPAAADPASRGGHTAASPWVAALRQRCATADQAMVTECVAVLELLNDELYVIEAEDEWFDVMDLLGEIAPQSPAEWLAAVASNVQ